MKKYEIDELQELVGHINGILLMFSTSSKTNKLLMEYIQTLILELQDQDMIDEVQAEVEGEINFDGQVDFLKYLISNIEDREYARDVAVVDKSAN